MLVIIDGPMINKFLEKNSEEFDKLAIEKFQSINGKKEEFTESIALDREESESRYRAVEDLKVYKAELKEMMNAMAQGIGNTPVSVLVEEGSLLLKVYEVEVARVKKEEEEDEYRRKKKVEEDEQKRLKKVEQVVSRKIVLKKKNSFNGLFRFCACSGKQFGKNN